MIDKPEVNLIGVHKEYISFSKEISEQLKTIKPLFSHIVLSYQYGNNKYIFVVQIQSEYKRIYYLDNNEVFILRDNKVKRAKPTDIEQVIIKSAILLISLKLILILLIDNIKYQKNF